MSSTELTTVYNSEKKIWLGATKKSSFIPNASLGQILLNQLENYPDIVIQINHDTGNRMTCREMFLKAKKVTENLIKLNIQPGDFVSLATEHYENLVPVLLGILAAGAVVNPLHSGFGVLEFNHFLEMVKPKLIICNGNITATITKSLKAVNHSALIYTFLQSTDPSFKLVDELFMEFDINPANYVALNLGDLSKALAFIICSSGTTGPAKGVLISHEMALGGIVMKGINNEGIITFNTSCLSWISSISHIFTTILSCSPRIITAQPITPDLLLEILHKHKVRSLVTAPIFIIDAFNSLAAGQWDLSSLKVIVILGSLLSENHIVTIERLIANAVVLSGYGLTEAGGVSIRKNSNKIKSVGKLLPGTIVKIITQDGNENSLGHTEIGEICVKKSFSFLGYLNNEEATKKCYDSAGWLHTGDLGYFDDDNDLFVIDREKDIFKYRNYQVTPSELEGFIKKTFDSVMEVVIVGIPDENVTSLAAAAIVLHENTQVTENDICKAIEENFSDPKRLRGGVFFFKNLPRTITGKFLRNIILDTVCDLFNQKNTN